MVWTCSDWGKILITHEMRTTGKAAQPNVAATLLFSMATAVLWNKMEVAQWFVADMEPVAQWIWREAVRLDLT